MIAGQIHPDFWAVARTLKAQIPDTCGGAAVCIYHRGEKVVDIWGGTRDEKGTPWEPDTIALSYSTTKGVASTLAHILADRGLFDYDDPVARYWPEFAQAGKEKITIRQIMCHEAGLYNISDIIDHARRMLDWDYMVDALAKAPPCHEPGEAHGYHGLTYGYLIGEIIQRTSGKPFTEVLRTEIAEPLELDGLYIGLPESEAGRRAQLILSGIQGPNSSPNRVKTYMSSINRVLGFLGLPIDLLQLEAALMPEGIEELDFNSLDFQRVPIPSANGMFTARSLARMYAALAAGGEIDGVRLLSQETLKRATRVQNTTMGRVVPMPMHWRLGYHRPFTMGVKVPRGFGHFGFGGSGAWADPQRNLAVAMVLNSGVGTPFGDLRIVRLSSSAARCADKR